MLLPSALPCDPNNSYFPPFRLLSPPPPSSSSNRTTPITSNILTTCRALQTFLVAEPSTTNISPPPRLLSPISLAPPQPKRTTASHRTRITKPQQPQRGLNKRRRAIEDDGDGSERERELMIKRAKPSTPPRQQRMCPPSLPLGLAPADFDALHPPFSSSSSSSSFSSSFQPHTSPPPPITTSPQFTFRMAPSPHHHHHQTPENPTSPPSSPSLSDETLITLLLSKLRVRRQDWDDCARRLGGTGKDSIGERWRLLVGEGPGAGGGVAMRRGGRRVRGRVVDVGGWWV